MLFRIVVRISLCVGESGVQLFFVQSLLCKPEHLQYGLLHLLLYDYTPHTISTANRELFVRKPRLAVHVLGHGIYSSLQDI